MHKRIYLLLLITILIFGALTLSFCERPFTSADAPVAAEAAAPNQAENAPPPPPSPLPTPLPTPLLTLAPQPTSPVATPTQPVANLPIQYTYRVLNTYPHDPGAFTQGLVYHEGYLYEGTGLYERSSLRKVELTTGRVLQQVDLPAQFFGEGIVLQAGKIVQLTWQNQLGFLWNVDDFTPVASYSYPTEGWGITQDGEKLIMSDGTDTLYFWSYTLFTYPLITDTIPVAPEIGQLKVREGDQPVTQINELEYIHDLIFANIWQTDQIVQIHPSTGQVIGRIDLSGLLTPEERASSDVLNGIAYDAASDRIFVTGKLWPKLFEIELIEE